MTRREFVGLVLGGAAAAACGARGGTRIPPGSLVETGMRRGHAVIRDGGPLVPLEWRRHRVVVIGSGVAGLTAAWGLRRRGVTDVVVLELDDVVGGTARGGVSDITRYPWGAHYVVAPQAGQLEMTGLLDDLGAVEGYEPDGTPIIDEALHCREPDERVFYKGRWYDGLYLDAGASAEDRRQLAQFRAEIDRFVEFRDHLGRPAFTLPIVGSTDAPEIVALDRETFAHWLDTRELTSERLRWLCDYACRDDYTLLAETTSAWAGLAYFAARQRAARRDPQVVLTWPDGNGTLVRHLAATSSVERGVAVRTVRDTGALVEVIADGPFGPFGIRADRVIVATPSFVARRIVETTQPRAVPKGDTGAWAVANVHLRDRPHDRGRGSVPAAWDNVFRASKSLGYVSATHQRGRDRGPTVWTWYFAFADEDSAATRKRLAGATHAEWAEVVLADLEHAHPEIRELVARLDIAFWGHGMVRPRPGVVFDPARHAAREPLGRIHFAHTDLSGIALFEEAFHHGLRAAVEVSP